MIAERFGDSFEPASSNINEAYDNSAYVPLKSSGN